MVALDMGLDGVAAPPSPEIALLAPVAAGCDADTLAPLPAYKAAGETVLGFGGLLAPAPALRLREDLAEGCGGQTWPAGMALAAHVLRHRREEMRGARILELGAGGGLVGLAVALACAADGHKEAAGPVYITDQEPMLALMEHNIALNGLDSDSADGSGAGARALVLNWGEPLPAAVRALQPTVVLAADCVYFEPAFPLLLATLEALLALPDSEPYAHADEQVTVYFCFKKRRRADMQFLRKAQKKFCVTELADDDRPVFSRQGLFLYAITRKTRPKPKAAASAEGGLAAARVDEAE